MIELSMGLSFRLAHHENEWGFNDEAQIFKESFEHAVAPISTFLCGTLQVNATNPSSVCVTVLIHYYISCPYARAISYQF